MSIWVKMIKKIFILLDICILAMCVYPLAFPQSFGGYIRPLWIIMLLIGITLYFIVRSEVTKEPFMEPNAKKAMVIAGTFIFLLLLDVILNRLGAYNYLMPLEILTSAVAGEVFDNLILRRTK